MGSAREPGSLTSQGTAHQETAEGCLHGHAVRAVFWAHGLAPTSKAEVPEGRGAALPLEGLQSAGGDSPCLQGASNLMGGDSDFAVKASPVLRRPPAHGQMGPGTRSTKSYTVYVR